MPGLHTNTPGKHTKMPGRHTYMPVRHVPGHAVYKHYHAMVGIVSVQDQFCQWEQFSAQCPRGQLIMLKSAFYGRLERGRCVERDFGYLRCGHDVTSQVDAHCSGRQQCEFAVTTLHGDHGCPTDLTAYLIADYVCVQGKRVQCRSHNYQSLSNAHAFYVNGNRACKAARCFDISTGIVYNIQPDMGIASA